MRQINLRNTLRPVAFACAAAAMAVSAIAQSTLAGKCVTTATMSVMFAPGTSQADIDRVITKIRRAEGNINTDYEPGGRWTLTMYGNTGSIGTACRFGYSFVPDGTEVPNSGLGFGPSVLQGTLTGQFGGNTALWKQKFRQMFDAWGEVSGLQYDEVSDDGAPLHFFPGQIGSRGDLRISGIPLEDPFVLAYNFFPNGGDMVINTDWDWGVPQNDYRFLRNTLGHEHGHGMGLGHVMPMNETKLMEPVLTTAFDGPQSDDIQGCQFLYGDVREDNDDIGHATDLGVVANNQAVELLAVERPADRDWYLVGIPAGMSLTVRAEPVGETYLVGPQGGNPVLRNGKAINNLRISAYESNGTTLIGSSNVGGLGFPETLQSIQRPSNGLVAVKLDVTTIKEDIQRYRLVFQLTSSSGTFAPNAYNVIRGSEVRGGLNSLRFSDDVRMKIVPNDPGGGGDDFVEFEVSTTSTIQVPTSMVIGYEGASSSSNVLRTISAWDYVSQAYVVINSAQSNMIEQTFEFNVANPARFVGPAGAMKMKVHLIANGPVFTYPWEGATDWIFWRLQ